MLKGQRVPDNRRRHQEQDNVLALKIQQLLMKLAFFIKQRLINNFIGSRFRSHLLAALPSPAAVHNIGYIARFARTHFVVNRRHQSII
jgi:hypothetical protein